MHLAALLTEIDRIRSNRGSLQTCVFYLWLIFPSSASQSNLNIEDSLKFVENATKEAPQGQNDALLCYSYYLLGYFYFYELHWNLVSSFLLSSSFLGVAELGAKPFQPVWLGSWRSRKSYITFFSYIYSILDIKSPCQPPNTQKPCSKLDLSSVDVLPFIQRNPPENHHCLHPKSEFSRSSLIPNIQYHLRLWSKASSFFLNRFLFCVLLDLQWSRCIPIRNIMFVWWQVCIKPIISPKWYV